ncbi:hypothetical protein [Pseudorhodoferax sp. Leaf267]|uniref:hypothetical protein n=1 Tax=Pseudorhodoferax sp. Leaf267 TaxID=1736316 RepID=UPI0006FD7FE1|nr:hypothetical protein [Pseudorhodoferax sp. Leaf267]KQP14796.1 hypothetical protein ASF43_12065 [Pseudorhodoferax sp. Leaf267]
MSELANPLESHIDTVSFLPDLKFELGHVVVTEGVHALVQAGNVDPLLCLTRHASGDWGDIPDVDKANNDHALRGGSRIFSMYQLGPILKVYVITEWDRSVTTLLLPSEY